MIKLKYKGRVTGSGETVIGAINNSGAVVIKKNEDGTLDIADAYLEDWKVTLTMDEIALLIKELKELI